jgi:hypothetical protein
MASCLLVFCVLLFLFRNLKVAFLCCLFQFWVFLEVIYYCFYKYAFEWEATPV